MGKIICPNCGAVLSGGGSCPYCTRSTKGAEPADPRLYGPSEPIRDPVTGRILHRDPYGYDDTAYRGQSTHSVPTHGYQTGKPITGQSNPFLQQVRTYDREVSPAAITLSIIFPWLGALMARNYEDRNAYTSNKLRTSSVISGIIQIVLVIALIVWLIRR